MERTHADTGFELETFTTVPPPEIDYNMPMYYVFMNV